MLKELFIKHKLYIYALVALALAGVNLYDYAEHFENHLKLRDYAVSDQILYNPSYLEEGYAADSLIREVVRGRVVAVPRGLTPYNEYYSYSHMHDEGNPFSMEYFWENNYTKYFMEYAESVTVDESLPDLYELQDKPLSEKIKENFILLGDGNDMMRYVFLGDHTDEETSNQFFYTYFYTVNPEHPTEEELQIRLCTEHIEDEDNLVALWDTGENLYLMSESYYEDKVSEEYR